MILRIKVELERGRDQLLLQLLQEVQGRQNRDALPFVVGAERGVVGDVEEQVCAVVERGHEVIQVLGKTVRRAHPGPHYRVDEVIQWRVHHAEA